MEPEGQLTLGTRSERSEEKGHDIILFRNAPDACKLNRHRLFYNKSLPAGL